MNWKPIQKTDIQDLNDENKLHHQAVQFIAIAGKYLLHDKDDDSNTNMIWNTALNSYVGNELPQSKRAAVRLPEFSLCIFDNKDYVVQSMEMSGTTWNELYDWFEKALQANDIDTTRLQPELHYEIQEHGLYETASFDAPNQEMAKQIATLRHNARQILQEITKPYANATPVSIWPHHFDTGTMIPLQNKKNETIATIGLGLAVADEMVEEPYFYVNHWMQTPPESYPDLKNPEQGKWIIETWKGSVLPISKLFGLSPDKQEKTAKAFFETSIKETQKITGKI
ncbi:MAG: hypothetical protein ACQESX_08220 [Bacteroidota bacterium]